MQYNGVNIMYNEIILEEAVAKGLPIIDLRILCDDEDDYSRSSPIEPSGRGARKIAKVINQVVMAHDYSSGKCVIYP